VVLKTARHGYEMVVITRRVSDTAATLD
jgi:hypothetical protein